MKDWFSSMPGGSESPSEVAVGWTNLAALYMMSLSANCRQQHRW